MQMMNDRVEDVERQIGKLMRAAHMLATIGENTTVESAKTTISAAEDVLNEVDMRDLCYKIDYEDEEDEE